MISSIQILRGIAAVLVVFVHIQSHLERLSGTSAFPWLNIGGSGVDIFFVISGFIIWVTSQSPKMTSSTFLELRVIRVVPLYWLITGFVALLALVAPALLSSTVFYLPHVLASFFFIPYPHPVLHDPYPVLVVGWTLNYEAFFYLLFGLTLLQPSRPATAGICLVVLAALALCGYAIQSLNYLMYYYTDPIILEFAFGLCIGVLYTHGPRLPLSIGLVAIPIGVVGIVASGLQGWVNDHHVRFLAIGLPAALIVLGATIAKRHQIDPKYPLLVAIGDASYSIYLTHVIVVPIGARLWSSLHLGHSVPQMALFVVMQIILAATAGWVVHRLLERPVLERLRRPIRRAQAEPKTATI